MSASRPLLHRLAPAGLFALASCAPTPRLDVAPSVFSGDWSARPAAAQNEAPASLATSLGSPVFAELAARATRDNADLAAAAARIDQARAQLRLARAESVPDISASLGASADRVRGDRIGVDTGAVRATLDVSWEIDLFGRLAAGRRAARARAAATALDRDALAVALEADLARAFVIHAALGERMVLLDRNIASARELARIIGVRQRLGAATRVDTGLQAIEVRQLELERSRLVEARARTRNAIALLAGAEAPLFTLPDTRLDALTLPPLRLLTPQALLLRRPDVRAAEGRIAAAEGDVDQARAAFFPQIRLSAGAAVQSAALGGPASTLLGIGADLLAPIFNRTRLGGQLDLVSAQQRESVALYRGTLLRALAEVEDALAGAAAAEERARTVDAIIAEARETARLARLQYLEGRSDLQTALDADSRLVALEDARAVTRAERFEALIDLYRASGGAL